MARLARSASLLLLAVATAPGELRGQTLDDGRMVSRGQFRATVELARERWSSYWEGELERSNANIGTLTTTSATFMAGYGVTDRISAHATLPYVRTRASQGVLHEMEGRQDVTVAMKVRVLEARLGGRATIGATALAGVGLPTSDYNADFQPLSIGLGARRALARGALHARDRSGLFADASLAHTWRSTVQLDRPAYYTNGALVLSDEVAMPDVAEYAVGAGYERGRLTVPVTLVSQRTLGGGDIRRQDMPFISNRMDFTRVHVRAMYGLPRFTALGVHAGAMRTLAGRNVGNATAYSLGLTSAFQLR